MLNWTRKKRGDDMYNKLDYLITDVYGAKFHTGCKVAFNYSGEIRLGTLVDIKKTNKLHWDNTFIHRFTISHKDHSHSMTKTTNKRSLVVIVGYY